MTGRLLTLPLAERAPKGATLPIGATRVRRMTPGARFAELALAFACGVTVALAVCGWRWSNGYDAGIQAARNYAEHFGR